MQTLLNGSWLHNKTITCETKFYLSSQLTTQLAYKPQKHLDEHEHEQTDIYLQNKPLLREIFKEPTRKENI